MQALQEDPTAKLEAYRRKRDIICNGLMDAFEVAKPNGAFYTFPRINFAATDETLERGVEALNRLAKGFA